MLSDALYMTKPSRVDVHIPLFIDSFSTFLYSLTPSQEVEGVGYKLDCLYLGPGSVFPTPGV